MVSLKLWRNWKKNAKKSHPELVSGSLKAKNPIDDSEINSEWQKLLFFHFF